MRVLLSGEHAVTAVCISPPGEQDTGCACVTCDNERHTGLSSRFDAVCLSACGAASTTEPALECYCHHSNLLAVAYWSKVVHAMSKLLLSCFA